MTSEINIREIREGLGESQAEFGLHFGVNQSTVHRWETDGVPERGAARHAIERFIRERADAAEDGEPASKSGKAA